MRALSALSLAVAAVVTPPLSARAQPQTRTTLHLVRGTGNPLEVRVAQEALENAFAARKELGFVPIQELLEPRASLEKAIREAAGEVAKGRTALENLEVTEGVAAFTKAIALRERAFTLLAENPDEVLAHAEILAELAVAHFLADEKKQAEQILGGAFVLAPKLEFDKKKHPPQMKRLFDTTRFLLDEVGAGELRVATTPRGAAVRINGTLVGYAPVKAKQIAAGRNLVTVSLPGYATRSVAVAAEGGGREIRIQLSELPGGIAGELAGAARGGELANGSFSAAARRLGVRWLVVGTASARDEKIETTLTAFDALRQRVAGQVRGSLLVASIERDAQGLVASLLAVASQPPAVARKRGGPSALTRFYRSPYFWPVVGGVLGAAAVGAGLGIYFGTREADGDRGRRFLVFY
jgi:hypothetical protein